MLERPDPAATARDLIDELGFDGLVEVSRRTEDCRRDGDSDGVRYWNAVGRHMRADADGAAMADDGLSDDTLAESALWRLMQRVEHFRHRAAQCRVRGEQATGPQRAELLEMEQYWLELAAYAELLAGEPKRP